MNFRDQIISLLRGRYAVPVISSLAELGLIHRILDAPFEPSDLTGVKNQRSLVAVLDYLLSIGILARINDRYEATEFGRRILLRSGSANIIESYSDYFASLTDILSGGAAGDRKFETNRSVNILGSGSLHRKKYFLPGLALLHRRSFTSLIDLGCGDGSFLCTAARTLNGITRVTALDLSEEAVATATASLRSIFTDGALEGIVCDAASVEIWAGGLPPSGTELLSAWFVIHEFCRGSVGEVVRFFRAILAHRPNADLLIGEIVKTEPEILAMAHSGSIMPEFLLFHALSGQAPLSWDDWSDVRKAIPYRVAGELLCDPIPDGSTTIPASFVWHLVPDRS